MLGFFSQQLKPIRFTRVGFVAFGLLGAVALGLCFVPGFNILNYYASLALGGVGGIVGLMAGASVGRRALAEGDNAFVVAWSWSWRALLLPPLILLVNGLFITNCNPLAGLLFYAFGAGASVIFGAQMGAFLAGITGRLRWLIPLTLVVWLGFIARDLWHLYWHPPVFAYNAFVGFFSGSVYDTAIDLDSRLVLFRVYNLAWLLALWAWAHLARRGAHTGDAGGRDTRWAPWGPDLAATLRTASGRAWGLFASAVMLVAVGYGARGAIGYEISRDLIEQRLGGVVEDPRVRLVYAADAMDEAEARALLEDHLFRLSQLDDALEHVHGPQITSYIYRGASQKRAMMGAGNAYIAKPWLNEIHLNHVAYGHPVLLHELSHVVLGTFAPAPLNVPTALCVFPHAAIVEGAAEAFEWNTGALSPHQWSAAMGRAKIAPSMAAILGPDGFYKQSSGKAYTLSGSFIRWLLDTRGAAALKRVYADGDFAAAYGTPLDSLVSDWQGFLDHVEIPPQALALAQQRFSRKGVFFRTCPVEISRLEARARRLAARGDAAGSLDVRQQVIGFVPADPNRRLPLIGLLARLGDVAAVKAEYAGYLALEGRNVVADARAQEWVADALWRTGQAAEAAALYKELWEVPQDEGRRRNVEVKGWVAADPTLGPALNDVLLGDAGADAESLLTASLVEHPDAPLVSYLLGRVYFSARRWEDSGRMTERALGLLADFVDPRTGAAPPWRDRAIREAWRVLGHSRFQGGDDAGAIVAFDEVADRTPFDGVRSRYRDWSDRCRWRMKRKAAAPLK